MEELERQRGREAERQRGRNLLLGGTNEAVSGSFVSALPLLLTSPPPPPLLLPQASEAQFITSSQTQTHSLSPPVLSSPTRKQFQFAPTA